MSPLPAWPRSNPPGLKSWLIDWDSYSLQEGLASRAMTFPSVLSPEEFASLALIGNDSVLGTSIPYEHLIALVRLRYVHALHGCFETIVAGKSRIARGI